MAVFQLAQVEDQAAMHGLRDAIPEVAHFGTASGRGHTIQAKIVWTERMEHYYIII